MDYDGLEWVQGLDWWIVQPGGGVEPKSNNMLWLPPLYPHQWYVQKGIWESRRPQMGIFLHPFPSKTPDCWDPPLAQGTWSEMWPLMLAYINMIGEETTE